MPIKNTKNKPNEQKLTKIEREKITNQHKVITEDVKVSQATEVRSNFQEVIDNVHYTKEALIISKHKKPWVKIIPIGEDEQR